MAKVANVIQDVYLTKKELSNLGPPLAEGGEAMIYRYNGKIIKVFKPNVDIHRKKKKVEVFIQYRDKLGPQTYGPISNFFLANNFSGYLMEEVKNGGEDFHQLVSKTYLKKNNFTNKDVLEVVISAAEYIQKFHQMGILIGDISDYNIMMELKKAAFIDVDSWGIHGKFTPDAYTELYTDPKSYKKGGIQFSIESEKYNFAVLAFYMLVRIHPFEGNYEKDPDMSTTDRMKKKLSVLGNHNIITKKAYNWNWMSPELKQAFLDIFEHDKYIDITDLLKDNLANLKYCDTHNMWYYSKYTECPICNQDAKVIMAPKKVQHQTGNMPKLTLRFKAADIKILVNDTHYISNNNEVVHIPTGRRIKLSRDIKRVDFSEDGKYAFVSDQRNIMVLDENDKKIAVLNTMYKMPYIVKEKEIYYVNEIGNIEKAQVRRSGIASQTLKNTYKPIFAISNNGEICSISRYPKRAIVSTKDYNFSVNYTGSINEYAIKYDMFSGRWLFVYKMSNGKFRTMIFKANQIEYDSDTIRYEADTISNICFAHNIIYDPSEEKIVAINAIANRMKDIPCSEVSESSKLEFVDNGFRILNEDKIFNFGN